MDLLGYTMFHDCLHCIKGGHLTRNFRLILQCHALPFPRRRPYPSRHGLAPASASTTVLHALPPPQDAPLHQHRLAARLASLLQDGFFSFFSPDAAKVR